MRSSRDYFKKRILPQSLGFRGKNPPQAAWKQRKYLPASALTPKQRLYRKMYGSPHWRKMRESVLAATPVCPICKIRPSKEVDHIIPWRGCADLFFAPENLRALCRPCHLRKSGKRR